MTELRADHGERGPAPVLQVAELLPLARDQVGKAIVGQSTVVELVLIALLARGHLLLEGPPGTGKTLLARTIARLIGGYFHRVQFTPDTTADEITGRVTVRAGEQVFEPGAVFTNVLLADEINRAPSRTQAALLEAMQEHAVTVEGKTRRIKAPFFVLATQNPYEHAGVYELPESQLDRFLFRVDLDYGSEDEDLAMLDLPRRGITPDVIGEVRPLLNDSTVLLLQEAVDRVRVPEDVARTMVRLVRRTREVPGVTLGAGPRSMIHVLTGAKARAALHGRDAVSVDDVVAIAHRALPHRIIAEEPGKVVVERAVDAALA
jgi:MoxR-like ATPase